MNGVINIWKEKGYTSFHVVYILRRITGEQKIGHTGTLDPEVSGVLPICIGKATKLVGQLTDTDKTYRCEMRLGKRTDTQDLTGTVLEEISAEEVRSRLQAVCRAEMRSAEFLEKELKSFQGEIQQIPPMYSALKVDGMKLVNAARKGIEVERKPRTVTIYSIEEIQVADDLLTVAFTIHCSKGTYVRTLCEDFGNKIHIPACMSSLERIQAAGLDQSTAITLEQADALAREGTLEEHLLPADSFLLAYPALTVKDGFVRKLVYGNQFTRQDVLVIEDSAAEKLADQQIFRVYDPDGVFYALYQYNAGRELFCCVKMFR